MEPIFRIIANGRDRWAWKRDDSYVLISGDPIKDGWHGLREAGERVAVAGTKLLAPGGRSKVLGLAYNYKSLTGGRADQEPLFFLKSVTSLTGDGEPVRIPSFLERVWVEVELALVIAAKGFNIPRAEAHRYVLGHTIGNDVSAVNVHGRDHHLARSKALDGFCPLGPGLFPGIPQRNFKIETRINGRLMQSGNTEDRILDDAGTLALISRYVTLEPGDVVLTGSCAGAMESIVRPGDTAVLSIEGIGELKTPFIE